MAIKDEFRLVQIICPFSVLFSVEILFLPLCSNFYALCGCSSLCVWNIFLTGFNIKTDLSNRRFCCLLFPSSNSNYIFGTPLQFSHFWCLHPPSQSADGSYLILLSKRIEGYQHGKWQDKRWVCWLIVTYQLPSSLKRFSAIFLACVDSCPV